VSQANGFCLILSEKRASFFGVHKCLGGFAEPVPDFQHSRRAPLLCFVMSAANRITHLGLGKRGMRAGTGMRRLNVKSIIQLINPITPAEILNAIPTKFRHSANKRLSWGGLFTSKSFGAIVEALRQLSPNAGNILNRFSDYRRQRINQISGSIRRSLASQQQAILTAVHIAGANRDKIQAWSPPDQGAPISFLDGLPNAPLREDPMVIHDMSKVPGF
jgi:hypothetical protein